MKNSIEKSNKIGKAAILIQLINDNIHLMSNSIFDPEVIDIERTLSLFEKECEKNIIHAKEVSQLIE